MLQAKQIDNQMFIRCFKETMPERKVFKNRKNTQRGRGHGYYDIGLL